MPTNAKNRTVPHDQWLKEAEERFGPDPYGWRFVCPACGHVASIQDWKDAGAKEGEVAFSCVGRRIEGSRKWLGGEGSGPCDYTGGGLFGLNPVTVTFGDGKERQTFEFAEPVAITT